MNDGEPGSILEFLKVAERLKDTLRNAWTSTGRQESTAEHTWRLCLMVVVFADRYPGVDISRLLKICIVHDLGEAINGDVAAVDQVGDSDKNIEERKDLQQLITPLPASIQTEILNLWDEYNEGSSEEARLAKAFDKLETVIQHTQGKNPADFDYAFNLSYGKTYTDHDELTRTLRELVDRDTRRLAGK